MSVRQQLDEAIDYAGKAARANSAKWRRLDRVFSDEFDVSKGATLGKLLTEEKQVGNRFAEMETKKDQVRYVVISVLEDSPAPVNMAKLREKLEEADLPLARCALVVGYNGASGSVRPIELLVFHHDNVAEGLAVEYGLTPVLVSKQVSSGEGGQETAQGALGGVAKPMVVVPMVVDDRIRRAIRISILTTSAVLLVGPPGTGKTTLLFEAIEEILADPVAFGFEGKIEAPVTVTPEEGWTARELIGGMTVAEDDVLRFREGFVLRAIREDRWLVLDEANRADLDKIFGALLTWLSDREVDLGPTSTAPEAPSVTLAWSAGHQSKVARTQVEEVDAGGETVETEVATRYEAGSEWRILGTYNALDAQRVFRFGQALGRRFVRVPIPPIAPEDFASAAEPAMGDLPEAERNAISLLYAAHFETDETELGAALFMRIPQYVAAGLEAVRTGGQKPPVGYGIELLAEAYLVNVGAFLGRYDDIALDRLGERIVESGALPEVEWHWVRDHSRHLA